MYHADSLKDKLKLFLTILWPIMVTQLSLSLMNLADTIMAGRYGTEDLAGVAIGASIWSPVFTGMNGVILAITPIIAHFLGRKEKKRVHYTVTQAIYLAISIALLIILIGSIFLNPFLNYIVFEYIFQHIDFLIFFLLLHVIFLLFVVFV